MKTIAIITLKLFICGIFLMTSPAVMAQAGTRDSSAKKEVFKGGMKIEKVGDDSLVIHIKKHGFDKCSMQGCCFSHKKGKFNGHWAGIDFGWNGYVTKDFTMTFPANEQYLNLKSSRSLTVNINPVELNLNLIKNHFGLTSGLGLTFNNYYFSSSPILIPDSSALVSYKLVDEKGNPAPMRVDKLFVGWLTLPVLFEYQTNPSLKANSFHISVGVVGGVKIQSYQKMEFKNNDDVTYYLQDLNGKTVASLYIDDKYVRKHSEFHLNPFKLDATARIGWSYLNLWATYSVTPMFLKNQGPELYPWSVGITLAGW